MEGSLYLKIFGTMALVLYCEVGGGGGGSSSGSGVGRRGGDSCGCGGFLCLLKDRKKWMGLIHSGAVM